MSKDPQVITLRGRLSWPNFTIEQALALNAKSKFPKANDKVRAGFTLLLEQEQLDKLVKHLTDVFLPWCVDQGKSKERSGLTAAQAKRLQKILDEAEWDVEGIVGLIKPVHERTQELAPEAAVEVPVNGLPGRDIDQKAIVRSEDDLRNPLDDIDIPARGMIMDIADTKFELYPGCEAVAQLNLFAFTGANVGITSSASAAIFVADNERFGGGVDLDEDDIFMDIDD